MQYTVQLGPIHLAYSSAKHIASYLVKSTATLCFKNQGENVAKSMTTKDGRLKYLTMMIQLL